MPIAKKKKIKIKNLIKDDINASGNRKYSTTYAEIKKYFKLINEAVFDNKLSPFNDIIIKDLRREKAWGQVVIHEQKRKGTRQLHLEMEKQYPSKDDFLNTLGHEMVHLWQLANQGDTGNHNALFYSTRSKLNAIGLGTI